MTGGGVFVNFLCTCVCIVQPEKETLEEKPFILPTDSPVSAPALGTVSTLGLWNLGSSLLLNLIIWSSQKHGFCFYCFYFFKEQHFPEAYSKDDQLYLCFFTYRQYYYLCCHSICNFRSNAASLHWRESDITNHREISSKEQKSYIQNVKFSPGHLTGTELEFRANQWSLMPSVVNKMLFQLLTVNRGQQKFYEIESFRLKLKKSSRH